MKKLLLLLPFLLAACDTREIAVDPVRAGYDYFPLRAGQSTVYAVESIQYRTGRPADTARYEIREVVQEPVTDLAGEEAFVIHRYYRPAGSTAWKAEPDSVWTAKRTARLATRTENNVTFVKLSFPLKKDLAWNGNTFNDRGDDGYKVTGWNQPYEAGTAAYENTVTVEQSNEADECVKKNVQYEVYARGIGLVRKEITEVYYLQPEGACDFTQTISYGRHIVQRLVDFTE
ncbi:MAG: hypothetical protein AVDCRST_MAG56-2815 [uncultured Cytophagales bacterium]|uniref:Lipoprotein n=1 Tax=uncultured Cytophagales bacterium TaxID=158755 RepID=A0A6J4J393_9SPHI|nr:MAG: hypothetical protein AVDCRST_MAG56-2815 [uncultured Cytophagales bacterium]